MCVTSTMIGDWLNPISPNYVPFTPTWPAPDVAKRMLDILERLDQLDKRLGAIDCKLEEITKRKFIAKLKHRTTKRKA